MIFFGLLRLFHKGLKYLRQGIAFFMGGGRIFFESVEFFEVVKIVSKMLR